MLDDQAANAGTSCTLAGALARELARRGVKRTFGVPGGGSLALIDAAAQAGIDFVLTRTETGAALMAATTAEITGVPGVVLTGLGPGAAAVVNGLSHAALDRAPLVLISDALAAAPCAYVTHQRIDQRALFAPFVKASWRARPDGTGELPRLIEAALTPPSGPVYIEVDPVAAAAPVTTPSHAVEEDRPPQSPPDQEALGQARTLLARARRPVLLVGLEARSASGAARALAAALGCPVLATWKAKGVIADDDPHFVGLFTGGAAEAACVGEADLIVQFGLDPVELIPQPWRYEAPVLDVTQAPRERSYVAPAVSLIGPLAASAQALLGTPVRSGWSKGDLARHRAHLLDRATMPKVAGIGPQSVVEVAARAAPPGARATIDAGAHMFPVITFFPAREPNAVLISNGLATMGFALPAAIASALEEPERPVLAFVGDGGLAKSMGELATLAQHGGRVVVVVLNDARLSLIDLKREAEGGPAPDPLAPPCIDFATVARGLGIEAHRIERLPDLERLLPRAIDLKRPVLFDVPVDPSGYPALVRALRG